MVERAHLVTPEMLDVLAQQEGAVARAVRLDDEVPVEVDRALHHLAVARGRRRAESRERRLALPPPREGVRELLAALPLELEAQVPVRRPDDRVRDLLPLRDPERGRCHDEGSERADLP